MKKIILILTAIVTLTYCMSAQVPSFNPEDMITDIAPIVCPASDEHSDHEVFRDKNRKSPYKNLQLSVIPVYAGNFPQAARTAIADVVIPIIEETFSSEVPVVIQFNWEQLPTGALANARPTYFLPNVTNNSIFNVFYPAALAEKLGRQSFNEEDEADIEVNINSDVNWCYDCSTTAEAGNRHDIVSVLLHELYHGLGFTAFSGVEGETAFQTNRGISATYNHFLENNRGVRTILQADESPELLAHFTGNGLFFNLPTQDRARLFSPTEYDPGSSVSHLNDATYNQTQNSLMTSSLRPGTIERAGGIATEMMYDMGWVFTYMIHEPTDPSIENDVDEDFLVTLEIDSENGYIVDSLRLHYSTDEFVSEDIVVTMTSVGNDRYEAIIPAPGETLIVDYYMETYDVRNRRFSTPGINFDSEQISFRHSFGLDEIRPIIVHEPIATVLSVDNSLSLFANVNDDFTGVDTITIEWLFNGEAQAPVGMVRDTLDLFEDDRYVANIVFPRALTEDDSIAYRIVAVDASKAKNESSNPFAGFHTVTVIPTVGAQATYTTTFDDGKEDFTLDRFAITRPALFLENALHTEHPYPEAGENRTLNMTAELNIPIILKERGEALMTFDEIVLVEPGEPNTSFGDQEFWDYVIVEGRKLGGNWIPLVDGYDSQEQTIWNTTYRGGIPTGEQDSNSDGRPSLYREKIIDLLRPEEFNTGDTVLIRFRLFSDPFAKGWGWAIDNLAVQDVISSVEEYVATDLLSIYPNPTNDEITLSWNLLSVPEKMIVEVTDVIGKRILQREYKKPNKAFIDNISLADAESGVYFVRIWFNQNDYITRKILKQ